MNTRKLRKKTWKIPEAEEYEVTEFIEEESEAVKGKQKIQNSPLVILFLEAWRESKEIQVNENPNVDVPENIAQEMTAKGYAISVNVARTKIANFIKKYNFAKKMAQEGKTYVWKHFNAVKAILEYGPAIVRCENRQLISNEHIKNEEKTSSTLKITQKIENTYTDNNGENDVELIEIPDDETANIQPKEHYSEPELDIDTDGSEQSDEELDFENPLDKIKLVLPNLNDNGQPPPLKMPRLEKKVKSPTSSSSGGEPDMKPIIISKVTSIQEPSQTSSPQPIIIPLPSNVNMPKTAENGTPMQYLIVRPITAAGQNPANTMAIPLAPNVRLGHNFAQSNSTLRFNAPIFRNGLDKQVTPNSNSNNIPKITAQTSLAKPPPLTQMTSSTTTSNTTQICIPTSGSSKNTTNDTSSENSSGSIHTLLGSVIKLETNIFNLQQERLQIERERLEMEREYGKEIIDIFREIKDKICDIRNHRFATSSSSSDANNHDSVDKNQ